VVNVEEGIGENVIEGLRNLGHDVKVVTGYSRSLFGRGQIIRKESVNPLVYSAGSDPRGDGAAVPFF
jgi:gamma-glutamyltranspeptidase/glutathione hydrolase